MTYQVIIPESLYVELKEASEYYESKEVDFYIELGKRNG